MARWGRAARWAALAGVFLFCAACNRNKAGPDDDVPPARQTATGLAARMLSLQDELTRRMAAKLPDCNKASAEGLSYVEQPMVKAVFGAVRSKKDAVKAAQSALLKKDARRGAFLQRSLLLTSRCKDNAQYKQVQRRLEAIWL